MSFLAASFRPILWMASADGPTNVRFAASTASTNSGFSDKKPYPGWMASALVFKAALMMTSPFK